MKKIFKSKISIILLTTIIVTTTTLYATTKYQASEILYNSSDGTSMNLNKALNELYKAKENIVEESKKNPEVISSIVSSLYNGEKKTYTISGKSINCASFSTNTGCSDSFDFDSGDINIYETPDGEIAVLNSIKLLVTNSNRHSNYSYESSSSSSSYEIILEDESVLISDSTIDDTLSLFNYNIGLNKTLKIIATGEVKTHGAPHESVGAYANASIDTITLTYIIL